MTEEPIYENVEVIEDSRNGQIIPRGEPNVLAPSRNTLQLQVNLNTVGTLELDDEAEKVLSEPLNPKDVRIRPDGLVYLQWVWYNERLNRAFGKLKWGLIPQGSPQSKDLGNNNVLVVWSFWLVIKGVPVSFAGGETSYRTNNNTMSYGDAMEGARSDSLSRNCKHLGMAMEMWNPEWVSAWKKEYAETYDHNGKTLWRKKGQKIEKTKPEVKSEAKENTVSTTQSGEDIDKDFPPKFTKKQIKDSVYHVDDIAKGSGRSVKNVIAVINTLNPKEQYTLKEVVELVIKTVE